MNRSLEYDWDVTHIQRQTANSNGADLEAHVVKVGMMCLQAGIRGQGKGPYKNLLMEKESCIQPKLRRAWTDVAPVMRCPA